MEFEYNSESVKYEDDSPYPQIMVESPNEYYADLLYQDYAGSEGEMTAFCQYEYHYMYNCHDNFAVVRHLHHIATVERKHMEVLGQLITMLGGFPVFRSGFSDEHGYWSGKRVTYGRTLEEQLKINLESEYRCICNYNMHGKLINDPCIKVILERIVKDEYIHANVLQTLIRGDC